MLWSCVLNSSRSHPSFLRAQSKRLLKKTKNILHIAVNFPKMQGQKSQTNWLNIWRSNKILLPKEQNPAGGSKSEVFFMECNIAKKKKKRTSHSRTEFIKKWMLRKIEIVCPKTRTLKILSYPGQQRGAEYSTWNTICWNSWWIKISNLTGI